MGSVLNYDRTTPGFSIKILVNLEEIKVELKRVLNYGCGVDWNIIYFSEVWKVQKKSMLNWDVSGWRYVWFKLDFKFNLKCIDIREIGVAVFFMGCKRKPFYARFMGCIESEGHVFDVKSFYELFKERNSKNITFDICNCKWDDKSTSASKNWGLNCKNYIKWNRNFSFISNCKNFIFILSRICFGTFEKMIS